MSNLKQLRELLVFDLQSTKNDSQFIEVEKRLGLLQAAFGEIEELADSLRQKYRMPPGMSESEYDRDIMTRIECADEIDRLID